MANEIEGFCISVDYNSGVAAMLPSPLLHRMVIGTVKVVISTTEIDTTKKGSQLQLFNLFFWTKPQFPSMAMAQ